MTRTCLIANPAAGGGRSRARLAEVRAAFSEVGVDDIHETTTASEEAPLAARAIRDGVTTIVAVGGDGTCSQIAGAILEAKSDCRLAVIPTGTGNDFAKTLGVADYTPARVASLVAAGTSARIDGAIVDGFYFINSCGFGFDASVLEAAKKIRILTGDAVYVYAALAQLLTYRGTAIGIDEPAGSRPRTLMLTVSNGKSLGGAFRIAPRASVVDGNLNVCLIRDASVVERIRIFAAAFRGAHETLPAVKTWTTQRLSLAFAATPAMEVDGELRLARSPNVSIECLPRALNVVAAPGAIV